jgi:hypothetical protein
VSGDVVERARAALRGITPGPWEHRTAPEGEEEAYCAGTLVGDGEPLHVVIAESLEPRFAYVVPCITGDGPTSDVNAEFIVAARGLVPELVAEVERLRARLAEEAER